MTFNPNDPAKPKLIFARSTSREGRPVLLRVDGETVRSWMAAFGSEAKLGEFVGLVHGVVLDAEGHKIVLTEGLLNPTAIFLGLNRPLHNHSLHDDQAVHTYITNPGRNYRYPLRNKHGAGSVEAAPVPIASVFATYVTFDANYIEALNNRILDKEGEDESKGEAPKGMIIGWEWVEESEINSGLPYDSESRFDRRVL